MIDDLNTWKTTLAALPQVGDSSWAENFAAWVDARVSGKMSLVGIGGTGFSFTFGKAAFKSALLALVPTGDQAGAILSFANGWAAGIAGSIYATAPGTFIAPSTPATLWSVVNSTIIDAPSIIVGQAKINELASAPPVSNPADSLFPVKFREAFLALTVTTDGLNSVTPTPGPLLDPARAII